MQEFISKMNMYLTNGVWIAKMKVFWLESYKGV